MSTGANRLLLLLSGAAATVAMWELVRRTPAGLHPQWHRLNYRGRQVSLLGGPVVFSSVLAGCAAAAVAVPVSARPVTLALVIVAAGAGAAGIHDDLRGGEDAKGLRGHLRALRRGRLTSGAVKVLVLAVSGLIAAAVLADGLSARVVQDGMLIAGFANLINLLDLRPGRAAKVAVAAFAVLLAARSVAVTPLAWCAGVSVAILGYDVRERVMLGDGGANVLGGAVGVGVVAAGAPVLRAWVLLAVIALTLLSEFVSFSTVIAAAPPLRWLDELGRADRGQRARA